MWSHFNPESVTPLVDRHLSEACCQAEPVEVDSSAILPVAPLIHFLGGQVS